KTVTTPRTPEKRPTRARSRATMVSRRLAARKLATHVEPAKHALSVGAPLASQASGRHPPCGMRIPAGFWVLGKEILRHLLRRPVVGVCAAARTRNGEWLLVRRTDSGRWALPGGTLEWGETLRTGLVRELREEAGVVDVELGELVGVYSDPARDPRFHAVTVVVRATVGAPTL